jgi:hypothetical protein
VALHAGPLRFRQLFLDDTFAACDSMLVPAFDSVMVVTHHITDADGNSKLGLVGGFGCKGTADM